MSSTPTKVLFAAYQRIQAGEMPAARAMLKKLLRSHPNSERGWLLLSMAVPDAARQRECLRRVLQINPFNTEAQARLASLTTGPLQTEPVADTNLLTAPEQHDVAPVEEPADVHAPVEAEAVADVVAFDEQPVTSPEANIPSSDPQPAEAAPAAVMPLPASPPPTHPSVTASLTSPPPIASGVSPVVTFEPDRPAPKTEPLVTQPVPEVVPDKVEARVEAEVVAAPTPTDTPIEPPPVAAVREPEPVVVDPAVNVEPDTSEKRSHRRTPRKQKRAERPGVDHRAQPAEAPRESGSALPSVAGEPEPTERSSRGKARKRARPLTPNERPPASEAPVVEVAPPAPMTSPPPPAAPPASPVQAVVNWPRMYEQPNAPASASLPERAPTNPPPAQRWDLPPAPQRDSYDEQPWPSYMLPLALLLWAALVIGLFFLLARLLIG